MQVLHYIVDVLEWVAIAYAVFFIAAFAASAFWIYRAVKKDFHICDDYIIDSDNGGCVYQCRICGRTRLYEPGRWS